MSHQLQNAEDRKSSFFLLTPSDRARSSARRRCPRRAALSLVVAGALAWMAGEAAFAQSEAVGGAGTVKLDVRRSSSHTHVPGRFSFQPLRITNERNEPFEGLCLTTFENRHDLQYGRRIHLPPQTRLYTWQPILVPDAPPSDPYNPKIREIPFRSLMFDGSGADEQVIPQESGSMQIRDTIWLAHGGQVTGLLTSPEAGLDGSSGIPLYDFVFTGRLEQGVPYNLVFMEDGLPPGGESSLAAFDQLIVADDRVLHDFAALTALRRWLYGGGRLWIMLDRVDDSVLPAVLGDEFAGSVVDRVGLTSVHLETGPDRPSSGEERREFDHPVEFVRLVAEGVDVVYTLSGWPAACWKSCGEGTLLITTLGADAWVRPRLLTDKVPPRNENLKTEFVAGSAFDDLMTTFFVPRPAPLLEQDVLELQARDTVGYTVPSKGLVIGMLSGFTLCLIGAAGWLLRVGEGQRLGILAPLAALVASVSLMAVGRLHRSLADMTAVTQFVQPIPGADDVRSTSAAATFVSESGHGQYAGEGGWLMPSTIERDGGTRRIVWSGLDHWRWETLPLTQGLHASTLAGATDFAPRTSVRASFNAEGIIGRLTLPEGLDAADAILVTPSGRLNVEMTGGDAFRARAADLLGEGQYVAGGLLSDEQAARGRTVASLLKSSRDRFPLTPTLLFWTGPWEFGTLFPSESAARGSALVAVPVTLDRPAAGTAIRIPAPFVNYREGIGPQVEYLSGLYNYRTRTWMDRTSATVTWIHFALPPGIAPFRPTEARLTIRVQGPMRRLEVGALKQGEAVSVNTWDDPLGTLRLDLDDPRLLELSPQNTLMLRIAIGDPDQPAVVRSLSSPVAETYRIESLALEIRGVVQGDDAVSSSQKTH